MDIFIEDGFCVLIFGSFQTPIHLFGPNEDVQYYFEELDGLSQSPLEDCHQLYQTIVPGRACREIGLSAGWWCPGD